MLACYYLPLLLCAAKCLEGASISVGLSPGPERISYDWVPLGAPSPIAGQSILEYIENIMDGTGEAKNEQTNFNKRDVSAAHQNKTIEWENGFTNYSVVLIDSPCAAALQPSMIAGDCLEENGETSVNCTIRDIMSRLWDIRKAHDTIEARNTAFAGVFREWASKAEAEWTDLLETGWLCPASGHDELRKLLAIQNQCKYYTFVLLGSVATGALVASVQVGITKQYTSADVGWVPIVNTAIGSAIVFAAATEFSKRTATVLTGGEAFAGMALWSWARRQARNSRRALGSIASGTATTIGTTLSGSNTNVATSGSGEVVELTCVSPEQAEEGMGSLAAMGSGGQSALDLVSNSEITRIISGQLSTDRCD